MRKYIQPKLLKLLVLFDILVTQCKVYHLDSLDKLRGHVSYQSLTSGHKPGGQEKLGLRETKKHTIE